MSDHFIKTVQLSSKPLLSSHLFIIWGHCSKGQIRRKKVVSKSQIFSSKAFGIDHFKRSESQMFLFSILHGKSFGLESVKTWNSPGFTKYSDWCFNTVWNSSDYLKVCMLFFSLWCSCDADASHDTRSFLSHKMILAQQLEVHLVLKVELH